MRMKSKDREPAKVVLNQKHSFLQARASAVSQLRDSTPVKATPTSAAK